MGYDYQTERPRIFTEDGQVMFLAIRDKVKKALRETGAITIGRAISVTSGDSWLMLACVDRMAELDEIMIIRRGFAQHGIIVEVNP
jgi:hypothetical protein